MRPEIPQCRGEWRREAGSPKEAPNVGVGKESGCLGEDMGLGKARENLPHASDATNGTDGLRAKGNLRAKRSDPSHRANALRKQWPTRR
jgi:hypothetical protein